MRIKHKNLLQIKNSRLVNNNDAQLVRNFQHFFSEGLRGPLSQYGICKHFTRTVGSIISAVESPISPPVRFWLRHSTEVEWLVVYEEISFRQFYRPYPYIQAVSVFHTGGVVRH